MFLTGYGLMVVVGVVVVGVVVLAVDTMRRASRGAR
jgi:hypothetical protein